MSEVQCEMPKYQCHKKVWALKIKTKMPNPETATGGWFLHFEDDGYAPIFMNHDWCVKNKPIDGGYYVVYEDGYKSFSPAEAFESGYTRI